MPGVGLRHTTSFHFISSIACTHEYRSCNLLLETTPKSTSAARQQHSDWWGHTEESSRSVHAHGSRTSANNMANRTARAHHNCRLQSLGQGAGACVANAVVNHLREVQLSKRRIGLVKYLVCASQSRADLAHVGNHVSAMISHARLLHLQRVLRCRAMSSTSDTFARIPPVRKCECVSCCVIIMSRSGLWSVFTQNHPSVSCLFMYQLSQQVVWHNLRPWSPHPVTSNILHGSHVMPCHKRLYTWTYDRTAKEVLAW